MEVINVLVAAAGGWIFGAIWYSTLAKQWMAVSGVKIDENGKPMGGAGPSPYIMSAVAMIIVAGFMRHIFAMSGIDSVGKGLLGGLGIGLFFISPWTMINNAYPGRPFKLTLIDGGYATFGCAIIGTILALF